MKKILPFLLFPLLAYAQPDPYLLKDFKKVNSEVLSLAYSKDGSILLAGYNDGSARLIDWETEEILLTVKDHWRGVVAVDMEPEGRFFITAGDNTLKIWTTEGVLVHTLRDQTTTFWSAHLDHTGRYIVSGALSRIFKVFDALEGKKLQDYGDHTDIVMAVRFSPDGRYIASASSDNVLKIRDSQTGNILMTLPSHSEDIYALSFSPDGRMLASASKDKTIRIYDLAEGKLKDILKGHSDYVMGVAFSPDGRYLLSCSFDQTVRLWDLDMGKTLYVFIDHKLQVTDVCFHPAGHSFASASMDKSIKIWELSTDIFVDYHFEKEVKEELSGFDEFQPRQRGESKAAFNERNERAMEIRQKVYEKYYEKYLRGKTGL